MLTVRADGHWWLHSILPNGAISPVTITTSMQGPLVAEWSMTLPVGFTHPALRTGVRIEVYAGPRCVWSGTLAEPDRGSWTFIADGLHRLGEHFDAAYTDASKTLDNAIDAAIARGLPWTRPASISTTYLCTSGSITENLNAWAEQAGKQWMVTPVGQLIAYDLPTVCDWAISLEVPAMPTGDDDYASALIITHSTGKTAVTNPAAATRFGVREEPVDLSDLTSGGAASIGQALLDNRKARPAFTDGVQVSRARLTTLGGTSPEFWQVAAGLQRARHHGTLTSDGAVALGPLEWVIGATSYTDGSGLIGLTPLGRLPRAHAEVIAKQARRIDAVEQP